jgi:hypothetical protein
LASPTFPFPSADDIAVVYLLKIPLFLIDEAKGNPLLHENMGAIIILPNKY